MTTPCQPPDPFVGQVLAADLRVLERVGTTTSEGPLYRAQYGESGPLVALTILRRPGSHEAAGIPSLSDQHWQQLRRACQIRDPHVAGLLNVGETPEGLVYAVGELLTGELLSDMLAGGVTMSPGQAVDVCLQAAAGLEAAHRADVVHGALSPQTILIAAGNEDQLSVKLIRFDFSGYEGDGTQRPDGPADPRYASPERRAGHAPDPLDDVFGLGAVLHHLLTGAPPETVPATRGIPRGLRRVVDRALASRRRRYPSMAAFAEELARSAAILTPGHRRMGRRFGWAVAGAALVAGGAWFGWKRFGTEGAALRNEVALRAPDSVTESQPPSSPTDSVALPAPPVPQATPTPREAQAPPTPREPQATPTARAPQATPTPRVPQATPTPRKAPSPPPPRVAAASPKASAPPEAPAPQTSSASPASPPASAGEDSSATAVLSPFRRSHPWAARPDGRTYFPSSCRLAFESPDLLYFTTEAAARATGRSRSAEPGCS
jgi:serine/threonine-protein kinase